MDATVVTLAEELIPAIEVNPVMVTPGVVGFIATFGVGIASLLLILDMVRRVRRVRYREEISAKLDAEEAAAKAGLNK
jgi:hypothetical protein